MALSKRGNCWYMRFSINGKRIQKSTGTADKKQAQRLHDELKAKLWNVHQLKEKPDYTWIDAVQKWLIAAEQQQLKKLPDYISRLRWLDPYLRHLKLTDISKTIIEQIAEDKAREGASCATVNRYLELIRRILRLAQREWEWVDKIPLITMRPEHNNRVRWLTEKEARRLIKELPPHLADMAAFTLATGLREKNVCQLKWCNVDIKRKHVMVHASQSKTKKAIPVPLNQNALDILNRWRNNNNTYVFCYKEKPISRCNNHAWRKALKRAGITDFRWHDLRHTWASWHVQRGTSLHELQQLGGWSSFEMVLRYAHLSSDHLQQAADRISGSNLVQVSGFSGSERGSSEDN